jgi:hypothetical protein
VIIVQEDSLIEAPTPNIFSSISGPATLTSITLNVMAIGFNYSKHTIKKGTTTLTSYSDANLIASHVPPSFP